MVRIDKKRLSLFFLLSLFASLDAAGPSSDAQAPQQQNPTTASSLWEERITTVIGKGCQIGGIYLLAELYCRNTEASRRSAFFLFTELLGAAAVCQVGAPLFATKFKQVEIKGAWELAPFILCFCLFLMSAYAVLHTQIKKSLKNYLALGICGFMLGCFIQGQICWIVSDYTHSHRKIK